MPVQRKSNQYCKICNIDLFEMNKFHSMTCSNKCRGKWWTQKFINSNFKDWQIVFIKLSYPVFSTNDLSKHLSIKTSTIHSLAKRLGFYKQKRNIIKPGDIFTKLTVISRNNKDQKDKNALWNCLCVCGKKTKVRTSDLTQRKATSCGCYKYKYKHIAGAHVDHYKRAAKRRGIEFSIDAEYADKLYEKQKGLCAISGLPLKTIKYKWNTSTLSEGTASLDRKDSSKGYIPGNVQWVHKTINIIKWHIENSDFIKICKYIADYQNVNIQSEQAILRLLKKVKHGSKHGHKYNK